MSAAEQIGWRSVQAVILLVPLWARRAVPFMVALIEGKTVDSIATPRRPANARPE